MWGQAASAASIRSSSGIIPTRVGTRIELIRFCEALWDHPHACGDKCQIQQPFTRCIGSSPRVWGQGSLLLSQSAAKRIIPTRVGTSLPRMFGNGLAWDHPHACGDKIYRRLYCSCLIGSSPRVWGQAQKKYISCFECGDHPHACGDKTEKVDLLITEQGSSPRVWGQEITPP